MAPSRLPGRLSLRVLVALALLAGVSVPGAAVSQPAGATTVEEDPDPLPPATDEAVEVGDSVDGTTVPADPVPEPPEPASPPGPPAYPDAEVAELLVTDLPPEDGGAPAVPEHRDGFGPSEAALPVSLWLPVDDEAASIGDGAERSASAPSAVTVEVLDSADVARLGGIGLAFTLTRADGVAEPGQVTVDAVYDQFRDAAGGDLAARLRLVRVPACALTTPEEPACSVRTEVEAANDLDTGLLRGVVTVAGDPAAGADEARTDDEDEPDVFLVRSGADGDIATYEATPIAPTGEWTVGVGSGDFTWSESLPSVPLPQGGHGSGPALSYSSASVDGRTNATNPQASWAGLGWDVSTGSITQAFTPCSETSTESCYYDGPGKYSINLNGQSSDLVLVAGQSNLYRMADDPGWQVLHDTASGAWIVTMQDGTRYYFGWANTSTHSVWTRWVQNGAGGQEQTPWAWSLSHVRDTSDNMSAYYYTAVTNYYQAAGVKRAYTRDGYLARIEFGRIFDDVEASNLETGQLVFEATVRCFELDATCVAEPTAGSSTDDFPDVPFDLLCASTASSCSETGPSFFSTRRLASVTSKTRSGSTWSDNDRVVLDHDYIDAVANDDAGLQLWLTSVQTIGLDGPTADVALPTTLFVGAPYENRSDAIEVSMLRLASITLPTGGSISVGYGQANPCPNPPPEQRGADADFDCFPAYGTRGDGTQDGFVWYNKWLVTTVTERAGVGGLDPPVDETTFYTYPLDNPNPSTVGNDAVSNPQIHHDDNENVLTSHRGWGIWRGYNQVTMTRGGGQVEVFKVLRGMHGDKLTETTNLEAEKTDVHQNVYLDYEWFQSRVYEHHRYNGATDVQWTTTKPGWGRLDPGNNDAEDPTSPRMVIDHLVTTTADVPGGTDRTVRTENVYDQGTGQVGIVYGLPSRVIEHGDTSVSGDERCTKTSYAINTGTWILKPSRIDLRAGTTCTGGTPARTDTLYDHASTVGAPPLDGLPTEVRTYSTGTAFSTTLTDYDNRGRVIEVVDPNDNVTATDYTPPNPAFGLPTTMTVTNALGHETVTALHPRRQVPDTITDPNGHLTKFAYDGAGRVSKVWLPTETYPGLASMQYLYALDLAHLAPPKVTTRTLQSVSGAGAGTYVSTYMFFDGLARERETQIVAPEDDGRIVTSTRYNDRGLVAAQTMPLHMPGTAGSAIGQPNLGQIPAETRTTYDGLGRVTRTATWSDGAAIPGMDTDTSYTGIATRTTPAVGMPTVTYTDAYGRTSRVVEEHSPTQHWETTYSYDPLDNLIGIVDEAGNDTSYTYDLLSRRTASDDPDAGPWTYSYDPAGNLIKTTDAENDSTFGVYDELNRKREIRTSLTGGVLLSSWDYDASGRLGLLVSSTSRVDGEDYKINNMTYDARNRLTAKTYVIPAPASLAGSYTFEYGYDRADHRTSITYPEGGGLPAETVTTNFSTRGYEVSTAGDTTYIAQTTYKNYGLLARRDYGGSGDVVRKYSYQAGTRWLDQLRTELGTTTVQNNAYTHDLVGNLTGIITDDTTTANECYSYDAANRLVTASNRSGTDCTGQLLSYSGIYHYSPIGNLESIGEILLDPYPLDYQYPQSGPGVDRPHSVGSVRTPEEQGRHILIAEYGYDTNGQRTTSRTDINTPDPVERAYQWDKQHRLTETTTTTDGDTDTSTYIYDADGNRLIHDDATTTTLYLDNTEINKPNSAASIRYYTTSTGTMVGLRPTGTPWTRAILNHQGSTQYLIRNGTNTIQDIEYEPYGETRTPTNGLPTNRRYLHAPNDDQTGLIQLGARYYDPLLSQFISPDPLLAPENPQTLNGYANSLNNPTTYTDPTGLSPICGNDPDQCEGGDGPPTPPGSGGAPAPPPPGDNDDGWVDGIVWDDDQPMLGGGSGRFATVGVSLSYWQTLPQQPTWTDLAGAAARGAFTAGRAVARKLDEAIRRLAGGSSRGAGVAIERVAINTTVSVQRQGRHVLGARQYQGGSYVRSADDAQRVLDDFHSGSATILGLTRSGGIVVRTNRVTGVNVNPGSGYYHQPTNVFFIKGSSSPSVVPYNPLWRPPP